MKTTSSRRQFIHSIVGGAAAGQLMQLMPHAAFGQAATPKRLLVVFHPMGYLETSFFPTVQGGNLVLGETQKVLEPHKSKLIYLDGLMKTDRPQWYDFEARKQIRDNEHGSGINGVFTGSRLVPGGDFADSASIDQAVANFVYAQTPTPFKSIDLAVNAGDGGHAHAFFVGSGNPVKPMRTAPQAWETLFSKLQTQTPGPADNTASLKFKAQRQRVIDNTRAEFEAVCARIGSQEKRMCDAHLAGILQLESRQKALSTVAASCSKPATPPTEAADTQAEIRARIDLIKSAFACNLSRVATLQIGNADGGVDLPGFANQHATTHGAGDNPTPQVMADHKKWDSWWASQWAYLLQQLDSVQEGNGTMLDNTLILFGSDTTTGQTIGVGAHQSYRFPMWLAGGSNFAFKTGRALALPYLAYKNYDKDGGKWTSTNAVLVSVARAMGLDISKFGTWDGGQGPVQGLA